MFPPIRYAARGGQILGGFRRKIVKTGKYDHFACEYFRSEPGIVLGAVGSLSSVRSTHSLSRPLMGGVQKSVRRIYLHDGATIDLHRKYDPLEPSLYFAIYIFNGHANESGGQVTQKLFEIQHFRDMDRRFCG
jgi:hypothetical protein